MSHFDHDDGLGFDPDRDPCELWDLADRAHEAAAGK